MSALAGCGHYAFAYQERRAVVFIDPFPIAVNRRSTDAVATLGL